MTLATSTGGTGSSLHVPNVFAAGALQIPAPLRASECQIGVVLTSETPMSVEVSSFAAPPTAAKLPS